MKIILVGALRYSNFGDILFAKFFYNKIRETHKDSSVLLYETPVNRVSDFCREELGYHEKTGIRDLFNADVLVYISGGYFSNDFEKTFTKILWHIRYALPGLIFARKRKKIYVIGIGGGEFSWKFSANMARKILNNSTYISARNIETANRFRVLGVTKDLLVNADTAQIIAKEKERYCRDSNRERKTLFLHIIPNDLYYQVLSERVFPAVKEFVENRKEYQIVLGYDAVAKEKYNEYLENAKAYFGSEIAQIHNYVSIDDFLYTLGSSDLIVTPKLHVGIVSASFEKSVLSFPINVEKTHRYYKNIGYEERCRNLYEVEPQQVLQLMQQYCDEKIILPDSVIQAAERNILECESI